MTFNVEAKMVSCNAEGREDYDVCVTTNRRIYIWQGHVVHNQKDGAAALLRSIADAVEEGAHKR